MTRIVTFPDGFTSQEAPVITGLATEAKQDNMITELSSINQNQYLPVRSKARIQFASTNVDNLAWVELIADVGVTPIKKMQLFMSSGEPLEFAFGAAASEVSQGFVLPGGNGYVDVEMPANTRVSIRAVNAVTVNSGEILVNFLG